MPAHIPSNHTLAWPSSTAIVLAQADSVLLSAPGFLVRQQALEALSFSAQAVLGPPQPVLMVRQAVGEIGHEERPLFQTDDLVPQLLGTGLAPHSPSWKVQTRGGVSSCDGQDGRAGHRQARVSAAWSGGAGNRGVATSAAT
jgi:hypothetical protein